MRLLPAASPSMNAATVTIDRKSAHTELQREHARPQNFVGDAAQPGERAEQSEP